MSYGFADNGDGLGLGGDSGSALLTNSKIAGIFTVADSIFFNDRAEQCELESGTCKFEAIYKGNRGLGVALTAEDNAWLRTAFLPEPSTWLLTTLGLALASLRRRD